MGTSADQLARFAARASEEPFFLGHRLRQLNHTDDELLKLLSLSYDGLVHLRLCGVPRPELWAEDIAAIADYTGANVEALAKLLREIVAPGTA